MPTEMAAIATIAVSANNQRGNGSSISFPPVKTAGFFKGLQTARQKHERDYFLVRLRLTIPRRMNVRRKYVVSAFLLDVLALMSELSSYVHSPILATQRECCPRGSSPSERFKTKTVKQRQLVDVCWQRLFDVSLHLPVVAQWAELPPPETLAVRSC